MKFYKICTKCNYFTRVEAPDDFCPNCGTKLISECRNCSEKIDNPYANYCKKCGKQLRDEKENESIINF